MARSTCVQTSSTSFTNQALLIFESLIKDRRWLTDENLIRTYWSLFNFIMNWIRLRTVRLSSQGCTITRASGKHSCYLRKVPKRASLASQVLLAFPVPLGIGSRMNQFFKNIAKWTEIGNRRETVLLVWAESLAREITHFSSVDKKVMVLLCFYGLCNLEYPHRSKGWERNGSSSIHLLIRARASGSRGFRGYVKINGGGCL